MGAGTGRLKQPQLLSISVLDLLWNAIQDIFTRRSKIVFLYYQSILQLGTSRNIHQHYMIMIFLLFVTEQACKPRTYARTTTFTRIAKKWWWLWSLVTYLRRQCRTLRLQSHDQLFLRGSLQWTISLAVWHLWCIQLLSVNSQCFSLPDCATPLFSRIEAGSLRTLESLGKLRLVWEDSVHPPRDREVPSVVLELI